MTPERARKLLETDPDFIYSKRFGYSLKKLLKRYPEGCPDRILAAALMMTEEQAEETYKQIVLKLRKLMGVTL